MRRRAQRVKGVRIGGWRGCRGSRRALDACSGRRSAESAAGERRASLLPGVAVTAGVLLDGVSAMTFSRFYDLVWRGSVFTCGSCQVNGGNDAFSPRRRHYFFDNAAGRCSEPDQALITRLSAERAHAVLRLIRLQLKDQVDFVLLLGVLLSSPPPSIVYLAGCLCVAAFLSPLILFLFSTFYYQQQKRCKESLSQTRTHIHPFISFYLLNVFRQKLLDRFSENSAVT